MKILIVNKFLYPRGGDAKYALDLRDLLTSRGHDVVMWGMDHPINPDYPHKDLFASYVEMDNPGNLLKKIGIGVNLLYSFEAKEKMGQIIKITKPDIVHLNSFAHQISPSILHAIRKYDIPAVMTLHDYKLVCASYYLLSRDGVCELCRNGRYYNCFARGCARGSRWKSCLNTIEMYLHHKLLHIYGIIDVFIAPSLFLKNKMEEMGFEGNIVHLPHFLDVSDYHPEYGFEEKSVVYFGRLSREKGLPTLIDAMRGLRDIRLKIIGEGALRSQLESKVKEMGLDNVEFLGYKSGEDLKNEIRKSMFVIVPSEWYENFPYAVIEAFALGKPVVGARVGGIPELVRDMQTGMTFEAGNTEDLRLKMQYMLDKEDKLIEIGKNARDLAVKKCDQEAHYKQLIELYGKTIDNHKR